MPELQIRFRLISFPEAATLFRVSPHDITQDDADRLWGIGKYADQGPDKLVAYADVGHHDQAAVIVHVHTTERYDRDDPFNPPLSEYFEELYNACVEADVPYLMFDRDATPVRAEPLW